MADPVCPSCGHPVVPVQTRFGPRWACCRRWTWSPCRPLVDARTHAARKAAHAAFDQLWHGPDAIMRRGAAYAALQAELGLSPEACHMALMDADTAERVPDAVVRIRANHPRNPA